jgi:hypothetical protein
VASPVDGESVVVDANRELVGLCPEEIPSSVRTNRESHLRQSQPIGRIVDPGVIVGRRAVDGTVDNLAAAF